ncbi:MAG: YdcF family protein, partial [Polyangiaceae bacterium]|nr:YdcF family protein [Polyangiaceae bacterium]
MAAEVQSLESIVSPASDDVAVVLGCRVEHSGEPSGALRRRAAWAAAAYRAGLASKIIAAGGRRWGDHVEAEAIARWLVKSGVPEDRVLMELCSLTTAENAIFSVPLLRRLEKSRAIVVTCEWHMPRAVAAFEAVGIEAIALAAPPPPSTLVTKVRRKVHELLSGRLDRHNFARIAAFRARGHA